MPLLNCALQRNDLTDRLDSIRAILQATQSPQAAAPNISREARGLSILLLYASYEHLLTSLCRALLETAARLRVGNRRLKPGLKVFAAYDELQATTQVTQAKLWRDHGLKLVEVVSHRRNNTIDPSIFPYDGTHMKRGQVMTFCSIFELGDPAPVLREVFMRLDTIVSERNAIAHGEQTTTEVGRRYTAADLHNLVDLWERRWNEFLTWVEAQASRREFYLLPR